MPPAPTCGSVSDLLISFFVGHCVELWRTLQSARRWPPLEAGAVKGASPLHCCVLDSVLAGYGGKARSAPHRAVAVQAAREELLLVLHLLLLMRNANEKAGRRIQPSQFYNLEVSENLNLEHEYLTWLRLQVLRVLGLREFPRPPAVPVFKKHIHVTCELANFCMEEERKRNAFCRKPRIFPSASTGMLRSEGGVGCCGPHFWDVGLLLCEAVLQGRMTNDGVGFWWVQDQKRRKQGQSGGTELVSVCQTAFCLTPQAKAKILQLEAMMQKQAHFQTGSIQVPSFAKQGMIGNQQCRVQVCRVQYLPAHSSRTSLFCGNNKGHTLWLTKLLA